MITSVTDVRAVIHTALTDAQLLDVIDRVESELVMEIGQAGDGATTVTEVVRGGTASVFVKQPIEAVTAVTEYGSLADTTGTALTSSDYFVWAGQGRLERLGWIWGARVSVTYRPQDRRAAWRQAVIDLVRIVLSHSALHSESVGGEYSYQTPDNWELERRRVVRRLTFQAI